MKERIVTSIERPMEANMSLESEILRYGLKTAKAVGAAEREYERQTELSLVLQPS